MPLSSSNKEPWLAVIFSFLLPGTGQIYAGKKFKGLLICLFYFVAGVFSYRSIVGTQGNVLLGLQALIFIVILLFANLYDAYRSATATNSNEFESSRKQDKDPWLAVFLSNIIPGIGHFYTGKRLAGVLFLIASIAVALISNFYIAVIINFIIFYFCLYHVYATTNTVRAKSVRLFIITALFILVSNIFNQLVVSPYFLTSFEARYIPSEAMAPTLQIGDRLIVNKQIYRDRPPQRGDIIVFNPPQILREQNYTEAFIKRIVGLPNEKVEIKEGKVYINDRVLVENANLKPPNYQWGPQIVSKNSYFVLGDSRNNSYDSRYWGYVQRELIIGKATKIFWPPKRSGVI